MTKEQCTAIIRAIEETTNFLMTNGISIRNPISDPTADATYVTGLLTAYDTAMEAIISDIPDDE